MVLATLSRKKGGVWPFQKEGGKVAMVIHIPLVEGRREESHGLSLFPIASLF